MNRTTEMRPGELYSGKRRDRTVDVFKGIAILMVIFVHSAQGFDLTGILKLLPQFGQMGCQIFFVMSAYTLCLSLDNRYSGYPAFIKKRLFRIVPEYWITILSYFILAHISTAVLGRNILNNDMTAAGIISNSLLTHGLIPIESLNNRVVRGGWFVGTLMIFYLLTPVLFRLFNSENEKWKRSENMLSP